MDVKQGAGCPERTGMMCRRLNIIFHRKMHSDWWSSKFMIDYAVSPVFDSLSAMRALI